MFIYVTFRYEMSQEPENKKNADGKSRRGRPPSREARQRALKVARDILLEDGFGRLTIEGVAERSGVGKPTIYRNWANAQELAMAALIIETDGPGVAAIEDAETALRQQLSGLVQAFATTRGRQVTMALAAADPDSEFTKAFRNRVILSSREAGRAIVERGIAAGNFSSPPGIETLLDMIYGPLFYRLLVGHKPLDAVFGRELVDTAMRVLRLDPR